VTITGDPNVRTIITPQAGYDRVFDVKFDTTLNLVDLTVSGGNSGAAAGGNIANDGVLNVTGSRSRADRPATAAAASSATGT